MMCPTPFLACAAMEWRMLQLLILLGVAVPLLAQGTPLSIRSFTVQQTSVSVRVTLTLSSTANGASGCFMDKITFVSDDAITASTTRYTPRYPGTCAFSSSASNILAGTMDISDYADVFTFLLLTSLSNSYFIIEGSSPISLVPGVLVTPISDPIQATVFIAITTQPSLVSFDLDLSTNQLLLHFDALTDTSSLNIDQLRMSNGSNSDVFISVTSASSGSVRYATTQCITFSNLQLQENDICRLPSSCFCYFASQLISDYNGNAVESISTSEPLQVSILRRSGEPTFPVFMRLSLLYVGCTAIHTLAEDEVFVLRPYETVSSINCSTNNQRNSSNIRPQISRQNSFSGSMNASINEYIFYDWPLTSYLNFSRGLPSELYGQYVCRSSVGYYVRNYVHDNISNIELPSGTTYRLPLKDPLTISLYFGTYPQVDLTQDGIDVTLIDTGTGFGISMEPVIDKLNPFHVDIKYMMVQDTLSGNYAITIANNEGMMIARQLITIEVTAPTLTLLPKVATVLPGQQQIELMCTTNSAALQVMWFSGTSSTPLSTTSTYVVQLPPASPEYNCSVRDPLVNSIVASGLVLVRNVQEILSVWRDGNPVENNSYIEIINQELSLQCIEHLESDFTNITWFVLPNNGSLVIPSGGKESDVYRVTKSGNLATLTIDNSVDPFRGLLKCSSSSGQVVSVQIVQDADVPLRVCDAEVDSVWGVKWIETLAGSMDFQPCPSDSNSGTINGLVLRLCDENGDWNDTIDISDCSSENLVNLRNMAQRDVFDLSNAYSRDELNILLIDLISQLNVITEPKATTHFPRDLDVTNSVLETLVEVLSERNVASLHPEIVTVFDNLLYPSNAEGWILLSEMNDGSQRLLGILEAFGVSLLESLEAQSTSIIRTNIVVSAMLISNSVNQSIIYPMDLNSGAQITIPASLLQQVQATGVVYTIIKNIDDILPIPDDMLVPESNKLRVVSTIMSTQLMTATGLVTSQPFSGDAVVTLEIATDGVPRAFNPICVFWDSSEGQWSREGVETVPPIRQLQNGEIKQYSVSCSSNHLTAFGIAVDVDTSEFDFSIPVYIGCGFIIFSSVLSIFSLFLSWIFDGLRRYSVVAFTIHMSFIGSLLCAYIAFLAGIEQALNNRIGCAAVAGLLHYFFSAAFSWLLCEGLLLIFFRSFSQYCGLFIVVFIIGWGLPAIPTAISLGILHESYGTTTQCWFFFDGEVSNGVVLGFIVPKLIIIAVTLMLLVIGCCTNCKFSNKRMQPYIQASVTRVLWLIWASICIFLFFLAAVWVFALLLVNVYGIDSAILGWVFMIASIILSVWMFIFSAVMMVINQKVDYERVWNAPDPVYPASDTGRGKGYQFMNMPDVDLTGRRTSTLTRQPQSLDNPVFEVETK